jgi:Na+/H+-dicarboxylate symporter
MVKKKKKFPLYLKIIIGMTLGILWGIYSSDQSWGPSFTKDYIKPFGTIFINLLKMIAIPIILTSLITGVASLKDMSKLGKIGGKTLLLFLCTALIATSIGIGLASIIKPGKGFSEDVRQKLSLQYSATAEKTLLSANQFKESGPLSFLTDMVPENITKAASDNKNMLQMVFFALILGIAIIKVPTGNAEPVLKFFESLNEILIKLVGIIMYVAPFGVFALLASVLSEIAGDAAMQFLLSLLSYSLTVLLALIILLFIVYPLMFTLLSKVRYKQFFKAMQPALLLGFSTSSSSATLPVTMERVEKHLGVPEHITGFVLPFGTTVNMDGTAIYQAIATVFVAQALGLDLSIWEMMAVALTATLAAAGAAGIPGAGMVTLVIVMESVGIPSMVGIALITPPDRILDMCRTVVNVAGDAVAAIIIAGSDEPDLPPA